MMNSQPVSFGLVGFGAWGQCHAHAITVTGRARLAGIVAKSESTRKAAAEKYPDAQIYPTLQEMLQDPAIEAIDIVLPSNLHHQATVAALSAGKHVLLEKPMGIRLDECNDMITQAHKHDVLLGVGHELRLSSLWGRVKQMIREGAIGSPQYVLVELSRNPYRTGADGWRYDISRVGNWILEEPIHFFDMARWFLEDTGKPDSVYATANSRQKDHPELQDNFSAIMHFHGGAYAVISQTLSAFEHHQTVKVTGTKGALWASWSGAKDRTRHPTFSLRYFDGEQVQQIPIEKITGELFELEDQIDMFASAVRNGTPLSCTAEDGRWSVAMCLAAAESVQAAKPEPIIVS